MSPRRDEGYVMAAALAVLFAMSLVASALVAASSATLKRAARAEQLAQLEAALESAVLIAGAQIVEDPRRRKLAFAQGVETLSLSDRTIDISVGWDHVRLDANAASLTEIDRYLNEQRIDSGVRLSIGSALQRARSVGTDISSLETLKLDARAADCARDHLTASGGMTEWPDGFERPLEIGQPAPGSRLRITAVDREAGQSLFSLVLITGDPKRPFRAMDWHRSATGSGDPCHAA